MAGIIIHGARPFGRFPLSKPQITIGRGEECDIFFPDRHLSRLHAEIRRSDDGCALVDMRSKNGTFLNGIRVAKPMPLQPGDVIEVGRNRMTFEGDEDRDTETKRPSAPEFSLRDLVERKTADIADSSATDRINALIARIPDVLNGFKNEPTLCDRVLELMAEELALKHGAILVWNQKAGAFDVRAGHGRFAELGRVALDREFLYRMSHEPGAFVYQIDDGEGHAEMPGCCMPLLEEVVGQPLNRVRGLIYAEMELVRRIDSTGLRQLSSFASAVAVRLENVQLHEARKDAERLEKDLRLAAEIQASMLPQKSPKLDGYEIAGGTVPCHTVGGDYFDFVKEDDILTFALGDMAGNGLSAAMLMVALRSAVNTHWKEPRMADAITKMNETFGPNVPDDRYATLFFARLNLCTGHIEYVNAGQVPPLLVRAANDTVEKLCVGGTILGAFPEAQFEQSAVQLHPGDTMLIYSDGVSDSWMSDEQAEAELVQVVKANRHRPAEMIKTMLLETIARRTDARPKDDRTVVIVKRNAAATA